jgi:hypothetical protein
MSFCGQKDLLADSGQVKLMLFLIIAWMAHTRCQKKLYKSHQGAMQEASDPYLAGGRS